MEDFHDDKEDCAGRCLLRVLTGRNVYNKAIFMLLQYGGTNLIRRRFALNEQVAYAVLDQAIVIQTTESINSRSPGVAMQPPDEKA